MSFHNNVISLILNQFPSTEMLRQKSTRTVLFKMLHQEEAAGLVKILFPNRNDNNSYDQLVRGRFTKNGKQERALFNFFNIVTSDDVHRESPPAIDSVTPNLEMHDYQREAIHGIFEHLSSGNRRCLLHMPTGSGKTFTAMRTISSKFLQNKSTIIIWLAYSEELCEQAIDAFKTVWGKMGDRKIPILRFYKKHNPDILDCTSSGNDCLVVAGIDKIISSDKSSGRLLTTLADRVSLIVMDEAHQAVAPVYRSLLEQILEKRPNTIEFLGLSATPGRTTYGSEDPEELPQFFGHKKTTIKIKGKENPIWHLIDEGYQARPDVKVIRADGRLTTDDLRRIERNRDIPKDILDKIGKDTRRMVKCVGQVIDLIESGHRRIIMFAPSVDNSRDISLILSALGYRSFHIDANTTAEERRDSIDRYRSDTDEPIVMCNYGVLTTGFDAPTTSAAVIARPTKSHILYNQMVGRAMRGPRVGGNKECEIRVLADVNMPGLTSVVEGFMEWEDLW